MARYLKVLAGFAEGGLKLLCLIPIFTIKLPESVARAYEATSSISQDSRLKPSRL